MKFWHVAFASVRCSTFLLLNLENAPYRNILFGGSGPSTSYRTVAVDEMEYRAVDVALEVQKGDFILLLCLNNST